MLAKSMQIELENPSEGPEIDVYVMQFILKHRKETIVIMEKAQGSCYEGFRERVEKMMEPSFLTYYRSQLKTVPDKGLIKILAKQRLDSCLQIVKEDYDMEYSLYLVKQIGIYAGGGTRKINREFKKASQRLTVELFLQHNNSEQTLRKDDTMKEKVSVTGVPETMIQTLYARAKESEKDNPMIRDDMAAEIVSKLDYDFSNVDKDKAMSYGVIARTIVLDEMVERYLSKNPKTVVINIASGMDTRCYRMKGKYLRWYNVDLPETMEIREKFLAENGPIYQIAKSAMDASYTDEIVCDGENVLVVIEGLSMYLQRKRCAADVFHYRENFSESYRYD